ncbi:MAG: YciI family protein [Actinomycetes bacterium]
MSVFVVTYGYSADEIELNQIRPTHRVWLKDQLDSGRLLASGPMVDRPSALLVWSAESIEELNALLDQDPFEIAGMIGERTIEQWNPIFGPFSA